MPTTKPYGGFELGPIRPPSEAYSLLLRINRGCGWNKCRFCGFYRDVPFSIRTAEDVKKDIDLVKYWVDVFQQKAVPRNPSSDADYEACSMAYHWIQSGMRSVFFQDGNSLLMNPDELTDVLEYLNATFPQIQRITTYARSDTINRLKPERLERYAQLKLNRFHIGLETGNDDILKLMRKGVTKADQIKAGIKAMAAGIEINEFYMPNMGGREYAKQSALVVLSQKLYKPQLRLSQCGVLPAIVTGVAQGIAVFPGLSRSGATISVMKFFGVNASDAAEFSFLLSIPIILASGVVEIWEAVKTGMQISWLTTATGTLAAFVSGLVAVKTVLRAVKNKSWIWFAVYLVLPVVLSFIVM